MRKDRDLDIYEPLQSTEAAVRRWFTKQIFLKISQNSQENICAGVSFHKIACFMSATLLKRDFGTYVFSENFEKFLETPF